MRPVLGRIFLGITILAILGLVGIAEWALWFTNAPLLGSLVIQLIIVGGASLAAMVIVWDT